MFHRIPEKQMHQTRWVLTIGWLILIVSLFYDPISPWLTDPNNLSSPLRATPENCIQVQNHCLQQEAYELGPPIFWGLVVPSAIFILLVFGHELWRRICPLSFLSQLPRALGIQRKVKRVSKSGKTKYIVPTIKPDSWLGRNYLYLQMAWFFVGLCCRILFINADRTWLAVWLLFTIAAAITVGYLYGGKSWCNFFCPMAPVQKFYGEPKGLLTSQAHTSQQKITQSTCREVDSTGKEKNACVGCQAPCIDIDSERSYWYGIEQKDRQKLYYGYVGLVVGYFLYYYLYAGNWEYYLSGMWSRQGNLTETLFDPGFYLFNTAIPIPKLFAVPLTLGTFTVLGLLIGKRIENFVKYQWGDQLSEQEIKHRIYTLCTFLIFNFFFIFAGQSWLRLLPTQVQYIWEAILISASSIWLYQTWQRKPSRYSREKKANRLSKQLTKLDLDISNFIGDKSLDQLNVDETYVLAKTLPKFTHNKQHQAYKNLLQQTLEEDEIDTASSLLILHRTREALNISDDEHYMILSELGESNSEPINGT